jgi:hypothetical protein
LAVEGKLSPKLLSLADLLAVKVVQGIDVPCCIRKKKGAKAAAV